GASSTLGHSQGLSALANVSGHELSEMLTDPQLNAWYDQQGEENSDKCAWTFNGNVTIGGQQWKIQGNWSNAAANANTGYAYRGCIKPSWDDWTALPDAWRPGEPYLIGRRDRHRQAGVGNLTNVGSRSEKTLARHQEELGDDLRAQLAARKHPDDGALRHH